MDDKRCLAAIDEAVRALLATKDLLAARHPDYEDPAMEAMASLEAARTARLWVAKVVWYLTDRAGQHGASTIALGFEFTDPYD